MKKILFVLFSALLFLTACGGNGAEKPEATNEPTEDTTDVNEEPSQEELENQDNDQAELDPKAEAEANAEEHPATPGKKLYDEEFKGMQYYFKGELVKTEQVEGLFGEMEEAFLVKNENDFILVIFPPYEMTANEGDEIEVWGPLSGDGYASSDLGVDNVVGATGAMNASLVNVNGELQ